MSNRDDSEDNIDFKKSRFAVLRKERISTAKSNQAAALTSDPQSLAFYKSQFQEDEGDLAFQENLTKAHAQMRINKAALIRIRG